MSSKPRNPDESPATQDEEWSWFEEHRDELEREAQSDGAHAWVCEQILQSLDEEESRS